MVSLKATFLPAIIIISIVVIEYIVLNTNVFNPLFVVEEQHQQKTVHTHKDKRWLEFYFDNMHDTGFCGKALEKYAEKHKIWRMTPPSERNVSVVIWRCHSGCGGIGDRFRGVFGLLLYSLLTDSMFLLDNTFPVELSETLSPSLIDWRFNESLIAGMDLGVYRHIDNQRLYNEQEIFSINEMTTQFLQLNTNTPAARALMVNGRISTLFMLSNDTETLTKMREIGFALETKEDKPFINLEIALSKWIHCAFTSLFKFIPRKLFIQSVAGPFALIKNSNFSIALHMRLGDHSFNTTRKEEIQRTFTATLPVVREQLQKHNRTAAETTIFVTSESLVEEDDVQMFKEFRFVTFLDPNVPKIHVDKTTIKDPEVVMAGAWGDYFLLSVCDVVITNGSGFSKLAAHLGGRYVVPTDPNAYRHAEKK